MNDKHHEFLFKNLYIIAGFLAGLGAGIGICSTSFGRNFLDPTQFPNVGRAMTSMTLILFASLIIGYLRREVVASERSKNRNQQADLSQPNT